MAFFRNALPPELFPAVGGAVQQCSDSKTCAGPMFVVITPISACDVDVCFAIDGSGSITSEGWQMEINVVDSITRAIGEVTELHYSQLGTKLHTMLHSTSVLNIVDLTACMQCKDMLPLASY
jgi:hypothetical protein